MEQFFSIINYFFHISCYGAAGIMAWDAFKHYRERDNLKFGHVVGTVLLLALPTVLHLLAKAVGLEIGFDPTSVQSF